MAESFQKFRWKKNGENRKKPEGIGIFPPFFAEKSSGLKGEEKK